jgi:hypothetical protein
VPALQSTGAGRCIHLYSVLSLRPRSVGLGAGISIYPRDGSREPMPGSPPPPRHDASLAPRKSCCECGGAGARRWGTLTSRLEITRLQNDRCRPDTP